MKNSYLCNTDMKDEEGAQASGKMFSGLTEFTACPARKNGVRKSAESVS